MKRGISGVLVLLFLILVSIAAVFLVWIFVKSSIEENMGQGSLTSQCIEIDIQTQRCVINPDIKVQQVIAKCPDLGNDGSVSGADLGLFLGGYICDSNDPDYPNCNRTDFDFNGDGVANFDDLKILSCHWGICNPPYPRNFSISDCTLDDQDQDFMPDFLDPEDDNPFVCGNQDGDSCDDCSSGTFNPYDDGCDDGIVLFDVKRGVGKGEIRGLAAVLNFPDGTSDVVNQNISLGEVDSEQFEIRFSSADNTISEIAPDTVQIAAIVGDSHICRPKEFPVECVREN